MLNIDNVDDKKIKEKPSLVASGLGSLQTTGYPFIDFYVSVTLLIVKKGFCVQLHRNGL